MNVIAPYITSGWTIVVVIAFLSLWAFTSYISYRRGINKFRFILIDATKRLDTIAESQDLVEHFEDINATYRDDAVLGYRWQAYSNALTLPGGEYASKGRIRSTSSAQDHFGLDLLRSPSINLDPRYHSILPNLFVGAGLLFTFLGLAFALSSAGQIVAGAAGQRNDALKALLDTASFKFFTSLWGLALSIAYTIAQKHLQRSAERALDAFVAQLDRLMPPVSIIALQVEANALLARQSETFEGFTTDLAVSLGQAMDNSFNQRLGEHIEPLTLAITRLSEGMSSGSEGALKQMLDGFVDKLQGGAGAQVHAVAENLSGLGTQLTTLQSGFSEAAVRMASSADAMANRMSHGAEALQARIDSQAEASAARLAQQVEAMVSELRTLAEQSRASGELALTALANQIGDAARGFEVTAARVAESLEGAATQTGGTFGRGAEEAVSRIAAATEGMRAELTAMMVELKGSVADAGATLRDSGSASAAALQGSLEVAGTGLVAAVQNAADRLQEAGATASGRLERGGEQAAGHLDTAGRTFGDRAGSLAHEVVALGTASNTLGQRFAELESATRNVIEPLLASSADLKAAGQNARGATEPLLQSVRAVVHGLEQMSATAQRLETASQRVDTLSQSLTGAAQRFEGVDKELAATLKGLQEGLRGFANEVSGFVTKTDSNLSEAAKHLQSLVSDLRGVVEDFTDSFPARG